MPEKAIWSRGQVHVLFSTIQPTLQELLSMRAISLGSCFRVWDFRSLWWSLLRIDHRENHVSFGIQCWEIRQLSLTVFLNPMPYCGWRWVLSLHQQTSQLNSPRAHQYGNCCRHLMAQHAAELLQQLVRTIQNPWRRNISSVGTILLRRCDCLGLRCQTRWGFYLAKIPQAIIKIPAFLKDFTQKKAVAFIPGAAWSVWRAMFAYLIASMENHQGSYETTWGVHERDMIQSITWVRV